MNRQAAPPGVTDLRVLIVEDSEDEALLIARMLERAGYVLTTQRVEERGALRRALTGQRWDAIVCDYMMPRCTVGEALAEMRAAGLDLPFIVVSGRVDEDIAVEVMRAGAHDFVNKDKLDRLVPALERERRDANVRRKKNRAQRTLAELMRNLPGMVYRCRNDPDWTMEVVSEGSLDLTGYPPEAFTDGTVHYGELIVPEDRDRVWSSVQAALAEDRAYLLEYRIHTADGVVRDVWERGRGIRNATRELLYLEGFIQDVTARREAERALRLRNRAIESSVNGILITEQDGARQRTVYVNPAFERITGYSAAEAIGRDPRFLYGTDRDQPGLEQLRAAIAAGREATVLLRNYRKDGTAFWNELHIAPVRDEEEGTIHFVGVSSDVSDRVRYHAELEQQANYDHLSGLPNRNLLKDRLDQALARASRSKQLLGVLYVDLDYLKQINDRLGHATGDKVIAALAERLLSAVRSGDTVARVGGDEFVILLTELNSFEDAARVAHKVQETVSGALLVDGSTLELSASIGVAIYPKDGTDQETLLRNADQALYEAKAAGRNGFRFHSA